MREFNITKNRYYFIFMGLLLPLIYNFIYQLLYVVLDNIPLYNTEYVQSYMAANPQCLDAIFCIIMISISLPFYFNIKKENKRDSKADEISDFSKKEIVPLTIIAFGCGGISLLWLIFADSYLQNFSLISESMKDFQDAFPVAESNSSYIWSFLSIVFLGPIVEEIIFRGVAFEYFSKVKDGWFAIIASGIIFGVWHMIPVQVVYTGFQGIVLGYIYYKKKNIIFPLVIHFINNFASELPPFMNNDIIYGGLDIIKYICIIPAIYLLVRMKTYKI